MTALQKQGRIRAASIGVFATVAVIGSGNSVWLSGAGSAKADDGTIQEIFHNDEYTELEEYGLDPGWVRP